MKPTPIATVLRKADRLPTLALRALYLSGHISSEQCGNVHKTSVRIRELQAALCDIQNRRLKRERVGAA
jgi:hypothetical protein